MMASTGDRNVTAIVIIPKSRALHRAEGLDPGVNVTQNFSIVNPYTAHIATTTYTYFPTSLDNIFI